MKQDNKFVGNLTETMAADYLAKKGFDIIERNFSNKFGEIDIIANDNNTLVFIEVKAKTGTDFGPPEDMITNHKLSKIRRMATLYLQDQKLPCRIDVVAIVINHHRQLIRLTHYPNVY
jgi:putative endonuclease